MNPNQGREAAYVKSRVKDLSLITNAPDYVGLFACITPKANAELEQEENVVYMENGSITSNRIEDNKVYLPQLVRDVDSLTELFGDPRVDPETYKDLLAVRYIIQNGFACYVAKVRSGKPYKSTITTEGFFTSTYSGYCKYNDQLDQPDYGQLKEDLSNCVLFNTQSSVIGKNKLVVRLIPYKPYSINQVSLEISFTSKATDLSEEVNIVTTRVILTPDTRNADLLKTINSYLGGDLVFSLPDFMNDSLYATPYDAYEAIESDEGKYFCIANVLLYLAGVYSVVDPTQDLIAENMQLVGLSNATVDANWLSYYRQSNGDMTFGCAIDNPSDSTLNVTQADYINSLQTFNDPKYSGCFISELSSDITVESLVEKTRYMPKEFEAGDDSAEQTDDQKKNTFINVNQYSWVPTATVEEPDNDDYDPNYVSDPSKPKYDSKLDPNSADYDANDPRLDPESQEYDTRYCPTIDDPDNPGTPISNPAYVPVDEWSDNYLKMHQKITEVTITYNLAKASYKGVAKYGANPAYIPGTSASEDQFIYTVDKGKPQLSVWESVDDSYKKVTNMEDAPSSNSYYYAVDPTLDAESLVVDDTPIVVLNADTYTKTVYKHMVEGETEPVSGNIVALDTSSASTVEEALPDFGTKYPKFFADGVDPELSDFTRVSGNASPTYYVENSEHDKDATAPLFVPYVEGDDETIHQRVVNALAEMKGDDRRGLHYIIKQLAAVRKNLTCVFTTPYCPLKDDGSYDSDNVYDLNKACNWVAARGEFADLFEYGNSQAVDYSEQAFYCEMYWSWLKWRVAKLVNGLATGSSAVIVPASAFVILNALASYRAKGSFYPVAGDQGGVLPDSCTVLQNPSTKAQRDKLISYRINPIYDTGLRGVQIYGNETLNPQFTDLSAAHIARTLVQIRAKVDAYSETIKFSLNDIYTWSSWINYVSTKILDPIKSLGGLQWYQVDMGYNTTTRDEISQRKIRGMISLQFTPDLEIIDLEFVIMASSLELANE